MSDLSPVTDSGERTSERMPTYDPATLSELERIFGQPRLMDLLGRLKIEIAQRLPTSDTDRATLGQDVHALLSVSGSLGFVALSARCSDVERACLNGLDLAEPLRAARAAALGAIAAITDLEARRS